MPTCLQAATAVHSNASNSAGMEFWVVVQPAGAPPLARAEFHMAGEFNATSASGSMCADCSGSGCNPICHRLQLYVFRMQPYVSRLQPHVSRCVDCSGAGQAVFGQGGNLGYSLSLSATGARVRLPGAGSDGMRSAAAASDASAQYPNLAIVRWRVEFAGGIRVFANGKLLGGTNLGALPALSLSELGNLHNLTLGTADTSSASDFFSGTALEPATPSAGGCSPMCLWSQPHAPRLCPYMCRAGGRAHRVRRAAYRCARRRGPRVPECQVEADPRPMATTLGNPMCTGCNPDATLGNLVYTGRNPGCNPTYPRWVPASARWESLTCVAGGTVNGVVKSGKHAGANISLPSALGQLSGLTRLSLRDRNHTLTGTIPSEIGQLSRLAVLELDDSSLRGDLPRQLASLTSLRILDLARTDVAGTLPTQLAQLTRLTRLHLSETRVSGFLPSQLGSLSMLTHIELGAQHARHACSPYRLQAHT